VNCSRFAGAIHPEIAQCAIEGLRPSLARCQPRTQLALVAQAILPVLFDFVVAVAFGKPASRQLQCSRYGNRRRCHSQQRERITNQ
jgi:hypothetical protein